MLGTQRYTPRHWSTKFGDPLGGRDCGTSDALTGQVFKFSWRVRSSEFGEALGGHHCGNLEVVMVRNSRYTWRLRLSKLGDAHWGRDQSSLKAVIVRTGMPSSSEFGDALGGRDQVRVEKYLEVVNGWRAGCLRLFSSLLCCNHGNVTRWLYLSALMQQQNEF